MFSNEVRQAIREELERGRLAQNEGNEGRARVCARRAAGAALREYLRLSGWNGYYAGSNSAYDLLGAVQNLEHIPPGGKESARRLLLKVDEDHNLPVQVNLLVEARELADELEKLV